MTTTLSIIGALGSVFALLAWLDSRASRPFALSERGEGGVAILTRTRRPEVQVRRVFVHGVRILVTADLAATTEWRTMRRDSNLILAVDELPPGARISVQYRRLWPWDCFKSVSRVPTWWPSGMWPNRQQLSGDEYNRIHSELGHKSRVWRYWSTHLL